MGRKRHAYRLFKCATHSPRANYAPVANTHRTPTLTILALLLPSSLDLEPTAYLDCLYSTATDIEDINDEEHVGGLGAGWVSTFEFVECIKPPTSSPTLSPVPTATQLPTTAPTTLPPTRLPTPSPTLEPTISAMPTPLNSHLHHGAYNMVDFWPACEVRRPSPI